MNSKELVAKRNKLMHDAGTLMQSENITSEIRSKFDSLMSDSDALTADIARVERTEKFEAEQRTSTRPPRGNPGENLEGADQAKNEKRAFAEWMRFGNVSGENRSYLRLGETRDLLAGGSVTTSVSGGSVLVPVGFDPQLHVAQKSYGAIVGAVRQFKTDGGGPIKVALADDTGQSLSLISEATQVNEADPNLSGFISNTDELTTGLCRVSKSLLADAAFSVDDFIQDIFAARYYKGLAKAITLGNGSNINAISAGSTVTSAVGGSVTFDLNTLIRTYAALDPAYLDAAKWVMGAASKAELMMLSDSYGRPLLQTDLTGQPFNALFGKSIVSSAYAPAAAPNAIPILFGDLSTYTLRTAGPLEVVRLNERYADYNEVGFIGFTRAGGYSTSQAVSPSIIGYKMSAS